MLCIENIQSSLIICIINVYSKEIPYIKIKNWGGDLIFCTWSSLLIEVVNARHAIRKKLIDLKVLNYYVLKDSHIPAMMCTQIEKRDKILIKIRLHIVVIILKYELYLLKLIECISYIFLLPALSANVINQCLFYPMVSFN